MDESSKRTLGPEEIAEAVERLAGLIREREGRQGDLPGGHPQPWRRGGRADLQHPGGGGL